MYELNTTSKTLTIIGLCLEIITVILLLILAFFLLSMPEVLKDAIRAEGLPDSQEALVFLILDIAGLAVMIWGFVLFVVFWVNLYLFSRLMLGKFTHAKAKSVLIYQAVWGGINIVTNQIVGIVYLVSAIMGLNKKEFESRE